MRKLMFTVLICLGAAGCSRRPSRAQERQLALLLAPRSAARGCGGRWRCWCGCQAPGGPLSPGYCYVQNRRGQLVYDRGGRQW